MIEATCLSMCQSSSGCALRAASTIYWSYLARNSHSWVILASSGRLTSALSFFFARSCLGKVPGGAPFSEVSGQLRVQFGCKLSSKLSKERVKQDCKQITENKFQIKRMQRDAVRPVVLTN